MIYLCFFILVCLNLSYAQQYYDPTGCASDASYSGSRYICNMFQNSCRTFLVYRANPHFQTVSNISELFQMDSDALLGLNNLTSPSEALRAGREVLIPIDCSCSGQYFQASFSYMVSENTSYSEIACGIFEGLLKSFTFREENLSQENKLKVGTELLLPLRCACPDKLASSSGVKYLVTYPFVEGDRPIILSQKFGISPEDLWAVNHLGPSQTVFPKTTVLVPLRAPPVLNFNILDSPPPVPDFLPTNPVEKTVKITKVKKLYIAGSVVGFSLLLAALIAFIILYRRALQKWKSEKLQSFTALSSPISCSTVRSPLKSGQTGRSSPISSCLSPDILAGLKYSLFNYSLEELRRATRDFNEENKIGSLVYRGLINNVEVMIKQMRFEDTSHVIDVHSKINHINILNLEAVSYGENHLAWSYLVFEYPSNGCLRDCLSSPSITPRKWHRRTQIAFDIATGLHYLHCCTFPSCAHLDINTRNIFVTENWRAKLSNIGTISAFGSSEGNDKGWVAPEYLLHGSASEKVDIFAFGVVLLELISAREDIDGKFFKESIKFLGGGASEGGFLEQLRSFMDPQLEDYPLAEALCLAVLAKACVEDDPLHRPSIDDIMKVLARMV
ncbi:unnamed protein product [Prunus armeniaca]